MGREEIRAPLKTPSGEAKCETFVVKMSVICIRIKKNHFRINSLALSLDLKQRLEATQKWPVGHFEVV